jgi:hypothetical protein
MVWADILRPDTNHLNTAVAGKNDLHPDYVSNVEKLVLIFHQYLKLLQQRIIAINPFIGTRQKSIHEIEKQAIILVISH